MQKFLTSLRQRVCFDFSMRVERSAMWLWLWVLVWLLVIYGASSDSASSRRSSRIIGPIARWLYPSITDPQLENVVFVVRKSAHMTEYAILAILLWRAMRRGSPLIGSGLASRAALASWVLATAYAMTDEFHQTLVPNRTGQWEDVAIDSAGAALGILALWLVLRRQKSDTITDCSRI
jgi:VanZ family protein